MSNPSKQKGTAAESAVAAYLRSRGWPFAERRTLSGNKDRGDIAGIAGIKQRAVIEVKSCATLAIPAWLREAETERVNDGAQLGAVWFKARGTTDPAKWTVAMTGEQFADLLIEAGYQ